MQNILFKQCARCIMDNLTDPFIYFDNNGFCNHCINFLQNNSKYLYQPDVSDKKLESLIDKVKKEGQNNIYDCIIGISGGIDSSYLIYLAKQWGVKPLAVHMDNGWNSKIAVSNIKKILNKFNIELYTYVLDWEEFKDLQLSFFKASVIDVENPTDMAIPGVLHRVAKKFGIKYVLSAGNYSTEGISPKHFQYGKKDLKYLRAIHHLFGSQSLKHFPSFSFWEEFAFKFIHGIRILYPLNFVDYQKEKALNLLITDFGWEDYGGKHHENIITKFVQGYYLPIKFHIDYRKATYSTMICNQQMSREEALKKIEGISYNENEIENDIAYIAKKFGISEKEFIKILNLPPRYYTDYPNADKFLTTMYRWYFNIENYFSSF